MSEQFGGGDERFSSEVGGLQRSTQYPSKGMQGLQRSNSYWFYFNVHLIFQDNPPGPNLTPPPDRFFSRNQEELSFGWIYFNFHIGWRTECEHDDSTFFKTKCLRLGRP